MTRSALPRPNPRFAGTTRPFRRIRPLACDPSAMEAALQLPLTQVRVAGDVLRVEFLTVDDACVVRLAAERLEAGHDPAKLVRDALAIGARVLDREQAGTNADYVKAEF